MRCLPRTGGKTMLRRTMMVLLACVLSVAAFVPGKPPNLSVTRRPTSLTAHLRQCWGVRAAECSIAQPSSRREVLALAPVIAAVAALRPASAEDQVDDGSVEEFTNKKMGYKIEHPASYKKSNKPVKTHLDEIQFKKGGGTEVGITVDPVKIESLKEFGTPKQVAKRVLDAEKGRDGVTTAKVLAFGEETVDGIAYYTVEYQSSSSRGDKHFISKVAIVGKQLYVLTALAKFAKFEEEEEALRAAVDSFTVVAQ